MKLSITIPSLPSRLDKFSSLFTKIQNQIPNGSKEIEILSLIDNKNMSVGRKRQALFQLARGDYVCQIDDDDGVSDNFIDSVIKAIESEKGIPEVINYKQKCDIDGNTLYVQSSIKYPTTNSIIRVDEKTLTRTIYRFPWHWSCWRNDIAKKGQFYDCNGVEDSVWPQLMKEIVSVEYNIDEVLVYYNFRTSQTESPYVLPPEAIKDLKLCKIKVTENE